MDDEHSSSLSSPSSSLSENVQLMEQNGKPKRRYVPGKGSKITIHPSANGDGIRRPFRQMTSGSSSAAVAFSSAEINCRKKSALQKQKNSSGVGGGKRIKCVLVGDSHSGKTALVQSFLGQSLPDYVPTTEDVHIYAHKSGSNENGQENVKMEEVILQICDTGGQEDMDRLRPLCYSQAQMVIICFSVMSPASFANVTMKWLPEVKRHCMVTEDPENPLKLLLVGTQSDLRSNVNTLLKLMDDGLAPISETQALRLANKIGALKYVESSAITRSNVNQIFDFALTYGKGKVLPKQIVGLDLDTGLLPNLTERKLLFWRRWRVRQNKSSKMKRLVLLPCMF